MAEPYLGEIMIFGGPFAIKNWALCNGQLMSVAQNTALFSLLGTTYGGDGVTTFALPDLRGRTPMHMGQRPGGPDYFLGQLSGNETTTLTLSNLPTHTHVFNPVGATATFQAGNGYGNNADPTGNYLCNGADAGGTTQTMNFADASGAGTLSNLGGVALSFGAGAIGPAGSGLPATTMPPYLVLNYLICLSGIYPSRN